MAKLYDAQYIKDWNETIEKEVCEYEKEKVEEGQIVFYGASHFTRWSAKFGNTPMREVLLGKSGAPCVVNRGFGSSNAKHHLQYYPRMIRPLKPSVLVYDSHGNYRGFGYTNEEVWETAQQVIACVREDFPDIHIYLCGRSRSKKKLEEEAIREIAEYEGWLREYAEKTPNCKFIDIGGYAPMQRMDIFIEDGGHFNAEGYRLFAELFRKELADELARF